MACQIWEILSQYFFKHIFSLTVFLLSFWDSDDKKDRSLVKVPQVPGVLFTFFQSIFSLLFRLDNFYCFIFKFTDSFPLSSPFCCWKNGKDRGKESVNWFHKLIYCTSQFQNFHLFLLYILYFLPEIFYFSFASSVSISSLKNFYDGCFKILTT